MALRIVVIGTGFGERVVAPIWRDLGCEVVIVSPRDPEAVRAAIAAPCDLVSVHSAPFLHLGHVRLAVEHGRNVLCDKPFGADAGEAREMLELATNAGVLHFLNFEFRSDPMRLKLKELLDAGAIGTPAHLNWTSITGGGRKLRHRWLFEAGKGGWVGAFGSHAVDTMRWLFGDIVATGGQLRTEVKLRRDRDKASDEMHPSTAEDSFTGWFRMASGFTAALDTGYAAAVDVPSVVTVFGSEGALRMEGATDLVLLRPGREPERYGFEVCEDPHQPALGLWTAKVRDAIVARRQIVPNFNEGLACVEVLDALRAAGRAAAA